MLFQAVSGLTLSIFWFTVCPRSSIVSYYIKWGTTSWKDGIIQELSIAQKSLEKQRIYFLDVGTFS